MTSHAYAHEHKDSSSSHRLTDDPYQETSTGEFVDELFAASTVRHLRVVPDQFTSPAHVIAEVPEQEQRRRGSTAGVSPLAVGRLVLLAVGVVAMFFLLMPTGVQAESLAPTTVSHVVQQGDTLWELAIELTPAGGDIRATVSLIKDANNMSSSMLVAGDLIEIPVIP